MERASNRVLLNFGLVLSKEEEGAASVFCVRRRAVWDLSGLPGSQQTGTGLQVNCVHLVG